MKYYEIAGTDMKASAIIMGCMRIKGFTAAETDQLVKHALDQGINYFDHANVYGRQGLRGECEEIFGDMLQQNPGLRDKIYIQSKCGIMKKGNGYYDFSKENIIQSTEDILKRLKVDYLDALLLHRPDTLMEPEEIAAAFETLYNAGKVRYFGVSNQNPYQVDLIQKYVPYKLIFNQLQFSLAHSLIVDSGLSVNNELPQSISYENGILEYSRLHDMTIQAWSPFQQKMFGGPYIGDLEHYAALNQKLDELAEKYHVTNTAIAVAWILRHPAHIQVILGTTNPQRMADSCSAAEVTLTRDEWYDLWAASGKKLL